MRFGIRDLLFLTTGASIYAATAGVVLANGGFRARPGDQLTWVLWLAGWTYALLSTIRARQKVGAALLAFHRWYRWWAHGAVVAGSVVITLVLMDDPSGNERVFLLLLPMFYHTTIEGSATVCFTESGVYTGKLRRWKDWRFELRPSSGKLVGYPVSNQHRTAPLVVRVPSDRLEEVAELLAKQANANP